MKSIFSRSGWLIEDLRFWEGQIKFMRQRAESALRDDILHELYIRRLEAKKAIRSFLNG